MRSRRLLTAAAAVWLAAQPGWAGSSIIGTTTTQTALNSAAKYYTHAAYGYYWVAFDDGTTGPVLYNSPDAVSWTPRGAIFSFAPNSGLNRWAVRYLGSTIIAVAFNAADNIRYYRNGTLNTNGTVSWSAEAAAGPADATRTGLNVVIANGKPIVWRADVADAGAFWRGSALTAPTWTQAAGAVPGMGLSSPTAGYSAGAPFPTGGGDPDDLIVLRAATQSAYLAGSHRLLALKWDASLGAYDGSWYNVSTLNGTLAEDATTEVNNLLDSEIHRMFAAARDGSGNLHALYVNGNNRIVHYKKDVGFNDSWSRLSTDVAGVSASKVALSAGVGNNLYVFYEKNVGQEVIYLRRFDGTSWGPESLIYDGTGLGLHRALAPMEQVIDCPVGLAFVNGNPAPYNVRFSLVGAGCVPLQATEGAGTVTVTAPASFELVFNTLAGGSIREFYDLDEDPTRTYDLAGSITVAGLHNMGMTVGVNYNSARNDSGARLDLLEATSTRTRVRQNSSLESNAGVILPGVEVLGDYSVYPSGRVGLRWTRKTTAPVTYDTEYVETVVRALTAAGCPPAATCPLSLWAQSSQTDNVPNNPFGDQFLLTQNETAATPGVNPGVRTDFLTVLHEDWTVANGHAGQADIVGWGLNTGDERLNSYWDDLTVTPLPANSTETWDLLTYFKPTSLGAGASPWLDPAVTSRSDDYRVPAALTINGGKGSRWADTSENTAAAGDWFNEAEAAYVLDLDPALGLDFDISGSGPSPRYRPFFKIRQWRSFAEAPVVTLEGAPLERNIGYRASVKPVARAHFSQDTSFHSTLHSAAAVDSFPQVGSPGSVVGGVTFPVARYGNGAGFDADGEYLQIPTAGNFSSAEGAIEFWYLPSYEFGTGVLTDDMAFFGYQIDANNQFQAYHQPGSTAADGLKFLIRSGGAVYEAITGGLGFSPVLWRANEWVHLRFVWDSAPQRVEIYLNGRLVASSASYVAPVGAAPDLYIGDRQVGGFVNNASGIIDEFHIYGRADAPRPIAHAGLKSDASEFLADEAKSFSFVDFDPFAAFFRGDYLYFGADAKFRGLNVQLATAGVGVGASAVLWEYWDGTRWSTLPGVTDQTDSFTKPRGTIFWVDPASWTPYSVNGGPDLYYVRASLTGGVDYTTPPVEQVIKTDILLFQHCNDIVAPGQTFVFAVPPTTEVKLESFTATAGDASVRLEWRTASELDNLGFHLYRSLSPDGPWTRLTPSLIPGLGSSAVGQAYSYRDAGLVNGTHYYYRLEDVDAASKATSHGPVSAVPAAGASTGDEGAGRERNGRAKKSAVASSCPDWVLSAYGSAAGADDEELESVSCTRHGDPEATSFTVLSRDSRQATVELVTGGFYALHTLSGAGEPAGAVRVFVPGFDFPADESADALPMRRALVEAVVGRRVELGGVRALELVGFRGLAPAPLGRAEMRVGEDGTVRAGRRRGLRGVAARERSSRAPARSFPRSDLVRLLPSQFQGEAKSAVLEIAPLRYDAQRGQLGLAKRVRVKLLFTGREPGESGRGSVGRAARARKPAATGEVLARLHTAQAGLHAASFEELFPTQRRGLSVSELRLERQGGAVAFHVEPQASTFGPGGRLFFHADRLAESTDFAGAVAYELVRSREGLRMPVLSGAPASTAVTSESVVRRVFETNRYYQPGLLEAADAWLWEAATSGATRVVSFALAGVSASGSAELEVELQGASESGQAVDHHVSVSVNGTLVGEARFAGKKPYRMSLGLPASLLREGANELSLSNVADTGVTSLLFLDRFALVHPQPSSAVGGGFEGIWPQSGTVRVSGIAGAPALLELTASPANDAASARWLSGYASAGGAVTFHAEAGRTYLVVTQPLAPRVSRPEPSTLRATTNQADYILVAPQSFLAAAEPLVERRRDQGLQARAVPFEAIAAEFGHGQPSAEAIRDFLSYAFHSWARPSPRYVLLVGDASYDPRNFTGVSQPSPLPALWTKTSYLWTASDPLLAAVNGEDAVPDLAIGRLPATTPEQAEALVQKLLAWEDSGQGLAGRATLVADNPDHAGNFEAEVEDIRASFLGTREARVLKLSVLGPALRPRILEALDGGLSFLSYVGHGGAAVWASENVWNSWDAASLQAQSQQPLLVTMNCLNGYFVAPAFDSLAESLLKVEGRGAIAAFSPSGLSLDGPAHRYHRALMNELTSGRHPRLGDAVLAAQRTYAESGLMPELLSVYHLLGDPATLIR